MRTGIPYDIQLYALASTGTQEGATPNQPLTASAFAYIDPYFSIDPSVADASAYSFTVSPGFGNAPGSIPSAIPEPSTWAMMLLGFMGLGYAGYRRAKTRLRPPSDASLRMTSE